MAERDIVVIGGGMAGSTAAVFAARLGRDTLVLNSGLPGGQLLNVGRIEDFPGFTDGIAGFDLCPSVQDQALAAGAAFEMVEAQSLEQRDGAWVVVTSGGEVMTNAVIVATGSRPRLLGIAGEAELVGRGISHCASCDGPLYRGQVVGVVGGGDSALQEALELAEHVDRVIVFHRGAALAGQHTYQARVAEAPKIEVRYHTVVEEVRGAGTLSSVVTRDVEHASTDEVELGGLFLYVGSEPNSMLMPPGMALDHHARVITDTRMRTGLAGLFAAGDIRADSAAQAVSAAGDGATAAVTAHRFLAGEAWPAPERATTTP
ncbi:MAG TPA: FAD-dependent oxidoreductase [Acidimicrobiia bacterium]